ncbi:hypothetical protein CAPTEDRAFT_203455 [Capitella teleta]|uniref:OB domain-containing protein n=1 Tax=Capitella teleta TaxID=283909 RepID=R7TT50_CAPTE|nr:hypothetical protein CAPTEDRAFT_203455 [Capitella teleta]|eukprot:ELT94210.1 hypothetical protein CAPTEDRAFT_203455 [Capitella teleta]
MVYPSTAPSPVFTKRKRQALYANPSEPHSAPGYSDIASPAQPLNRPGFLPNPRKSSEVSKEMTNRVATEADCTLRVLSTNVSGLVKWARHKDQLPLMFEIFGQLNSEVTDRNGGGKLFVLKSEGECVNCVFYQIDRCLPVMGQNHWYRCVGSYDSKQGLLKTVSVRALRPNENALIRPLVNATDKAMRQWLAQHKSLESRKAKK